MSSVKLSVLIPTVFGREDCLKGLLAEISKQCGHALFDIVINKHYPNEDIFINKYRNGVDVMVFKDDKSITIGEKRELLYASCEGEYSFMIDDDDMIAPNAIELILAAIDNKPDCITYREKCIMNGVYQSSNHSLKYDKWQDNFDGFDYVRTPFYKDVIKTEISRSVPFPHIRYNEDEQWAAALKPHLKTEVHIDEELYYYIYNSQPEESHEKRYGIV